MSTGLVNLGNLKDETFKKSQSPVYLLICAIINHMVILLHERQMFSIYSHTSQFISAAQKYHEACNTLTTATWKRDMMIRDTSKTAIVRLTELCKFNTTCIAAETNCVGTLKLLLAELVQFLSWVTSIWTTDDTSVIQYIQKLEQLTALAANKEKWLARNTFLSTTLEKLIAVTQQSSTAVQNLQIEDVSKKTLQCVQIGESNALEKIIAFAQQLSREVQDNALALFAAAIDAAKGEQFDTLHQKREEANEQVVTVSAEIVQAQHTVNELSIDLGKYQEAVKSASDEMDKIYDVRDNSKLCPYDPYNLCGNRRECCNVKIAACNKMTAAAKLVEKKKTQITEAKETLFYANRRYEAAKQALVTVEQQISDAEQKFNDAEKRIRDFCKNDVSAPQ